MAERRGALLARRSRRRPPGAVDSSMLLEISRLLYKAYGPQGWWPGDSKFEIVLGAILTQACSWTGVERALANLKVSGCFSPEGLRDIPQDELAALLRPTVYFNAKARKLKAFINHLWDSYHGVLEAFMSRGAKELREELLSIHGIGDETADSILLYVAGQPSFVIDAYTRRIFDRLEPAPKAKSYQALQGMFHRHLPAAAPLFNEYHALLDRHAKETCKTLPRCEGCCLRGICWTGLASIDTPDSRNL